MKISILKDSFFQVVQRIKLLDCSRFLKKLLNRKLYLSVLILLLANKLFTECQLPEIHLQTSFIVASKRKAIRFVWQLKMYVHEKTHSTRV